MISLCRTSSETSSTYIYHLYIPVQWYNDVQVTRTSTWFVPRDSINGENKYLPKQIAAVTNCLMQNLILIFLSRKITCNQEIVIMKYMGQVDHLTISENVKYSVEWLQGIMNGWTFFISCIHGVKPPTRKLLFWDDQWRNKGNIMLI